MTRYLSLEDTERLDLRMRELVPVVEAAFRTVAEGRSVVAPRVRLTHPPLAEGSRGEGRPWTRDMRIIPGAIEGIGFGIRPSSTVKLTPSTALTPPRSVVNVLPSRSTTSISSLSYSRRAAGEAGIEPPIATREGLRKLVREFALDPVGVTPARLREALRNAGNPSPEPMDFITFWLWALLATNVTETCANRAKSQE